MEKCEIIKTEYLKELAIIKMELTSKTKKLEANQAQDEAVHEKIKLNIVDIFTTLFNVSCKKAIKPGAGEEENARQLKGCYLDFFQSIPASWKEKMNKDKEHGMMEEYYKEEIKLETMERVKAVFLEHYDRVFLEV